MIFKSYYSYGFKVWKSITFAPACLSKVKPVQRMNLTQLHGKIKHFEQTKCTNEPSCSLFMLYWLCTYKLWELELNVVAIIVTSRGHNRDCVTHSAMCNHSGEMCLLLQEGYKYICKVWKTIKENVL